MVESVKRVCHRCHVERPISEFYVEAEQREAARRGKAAVRKPCRHCVREKYQKKRAPRQEYIDKVKAENGCADCGLRPEILLVLDLSHRPGTEKLFDISDRMTSGSLEAFKAEVAKCDVVCANCNRIRAYREAKFGAQYGKPRGNALQRLKDQEAGLGHVWS